MNENKNTGRNYLVVAMRGRGGKPYKQTLEPNGLLVTNALTTVEKDNLILEMTRLNDVFIEVEKK